MVHSDDVKNSSIVGRTFCVRTEAGQGTAFTMDVDGKRYLITAQHVIGQNPNRSITIESDSGQERIDIELVGYSAAELDVAVLRPSKPIHDHCYRTEPHDSESSSIVIGGDVYSCGFPLGLSTKVFYFPNFPYPIPLLRRWMVSGFDVDQYYLDGFVNPGASGSPVFKMKGTIPIVIGVVVARRKEPSSVTDGRRYTGGQVDLNSGIVMVTAIEQAMELIRTNSNGLRI